MLEDLTIGSGRRCNCPAGETCHDFQKNRGMIFRLGLPVYPLDADPLKRLPNARKWAAVERTRQIVRGIGEKFAASQPNEQSEMLPCRSFGIRSGRSRRELCVREAQRSPVPREMSQSSQQLGVGTSQQ